MTRLLLPCLLATLAFPTAAMTGDTTAPLVGPDLVFEERDGFVAVEAEHFHKQTLTSAREWHVTSVHHTPAVQPDGDPPHLAGASGGAYLEILPDTRRTHDDPLVPGENFSNEPGRIGVLHYKVHFTTPGRYYVWVRAYSTGTEDNGLHVGLNGGWPASGRRMQWCEGKNGWRWESRQRTEQEHCGVPHAIYLDVPAPGEHEIQFSMREDGFEFDRFILTTDRAFTPPGDGGPASRVRFGRLPVPPAAQGGATGGARDGRSARRAGQPAAARSAGGAAISGEVKRWHRVSLTFEGPATDEKATPNPFTDYRLDVTFDHPESGDRRTVPGFFAADGDAAESGATSGDKWRVHFSPSQPGEWRWRVSFRSGPDVAMADDVTAGQPWAPLDGRAGTFSVAPSDKQPPDFRARGHLEYVGERYLRFAGDGTRFLKGGVDSPETMLGYEDFDGTFLDRSTGNRPPAPNPPIKLPALVDGLHQFTPHVKDWREGDPTWRGGKGKGLIGGINYLASQGVNSAYFLTMNVNGDGRNVWPWIDPWVQDRFDCSKLDQWEIVFAHMTSRGIQLHVVTQETENDHLLDRGDLGRSRRLYYRELVARFSHHPAITWNMGEENVQSVDQQKAMASWLRRLLPYRQHIVIHNDHWHAKNVRETFDPLLGFEAYTGTSLQDFYWNDVHTHVRHYVRASAEAGHPWVVNADEMGGADFGTLTDTDDPDHDDPRRFGLWGNLMAGGGGVEWYFGWQNNSPHSDLSAEDWRTRERMYRQTTLALDFVQAHLPFHRMVPADDAVVGHGVYGLMAPGEVYALYLPNGNGTRVDLGPHPGAYEIAWFNPRTGGELRRGNITELRGPGLGWTGLPPEDLSRDWLALVRRIPETAPAMQFPADTWQEMRPMALGIVPAGLGHAMNYWRMPTGPDGVNGVVIVRRGVIVHRGPQAERRVPLEQVLQLPLAGGAGIGFGADDGAVSALDLARLGHLVLNEGRWAGRQVVEAAQLAAWRAATDAARVPDGLTRAFYLAGLDGGRARVLVVPEWEMIVVRLATDDDPPDAERVMQTFLRRLGMAVAPLTEGP
jgi:hypothetical protein